MKLNADCPLPIYRVLKDQSQGKICKYLTKKTAPIQSNSWMVIRSATIADCDDESFILYNNVCLPQVPYLIVDRHACILFKKNIAVILPE